MDCHVPGVQLWKILDVALLCDIHIHTPVPAAPSVSDRLELCLYNQVCKKLANLICNAQNIEQLREICGVTADGFTQEERMQNFARLERCVLARESPCCSRVLVF